MAARSLIQLFRGLDPQMLNKKDRVRLTYSSVLERVHSATLSTPSIQILSNFSLKVRVALNHKIGVEELRRTRPSLE